MKKIYKWEPWFFLFFGVFHLHRIWALIDREGYASFWQKILDFMFDTQSPYWNFIWGFFILLGGFVFALGIRLIGKRKNE